jgi:hypothetical protein
VRTYHFVKGKIYPKQVSILREDSLGSQMSKAQLLKRKWSEDMTRNVRMARESLCESARKRAKVRGDLFALKLRKLRKWPPFGMPKAAKVAHPPRRPLSCESGPPLKTRGTRPPRGPAVYIRTKFQLESRNHHVCTGYIVISIPVSCLQDPATARTTTALHETRLSGMKLHKARQTRALLAPKA